MLEVLNLYYEYTDQSALSDVSFTIEPQTITALIGPNGSGKTTLLRCLAALQTPHSGSITLNGMNVHEFPRDSHKQLGYLADDFGLYADLTVAQCLEHAAAMQGLKHSDLQKAVHNTLDKLALGPYRNKKTKTLSRGWKQRAGIGTAIIHQPLLLLLDEPASGLDPEARQELSSLMCQLRDQGMTLIISSHILAELESYCQDMLVLRSGELVHHIASEAKENEHKIYVTLLKFMPELESILREETYVKNLEINELQYTFDWSGGYQEQSVLLKRLIKANAPITSFCHREMSLQDRYFFSLQADAP